MVGGGCWSIFLGFLPLLVGSREKLQRSGSWKAIGLERAFELSQSQTTRGAAGDQGADGYLRV
jgi:hypothetical protein